MMNMPTKRQVLINQARTLLNDLQSPAFFDHNETLAFTIDEVDFEYSEEDLDQQQP